MRQNRLISFRQWVAKTASFLETIVAVLVLVSTLVAGVRVGIDLASVVVYTDLNEAFSQFLRNAFNVIIGIEFVKMLAKHSPGSAIEVLLFAIARQMVVEHTSPVENLISIVAILLIFVIRKYLFVPAFGAHMPGADTFSESGLSSDMKEKLAELHLQQAHMKEELQKMNQQCMMVPRTEKEQAGSQE